MKKPLLTLVLALVVNYIYGQATCASPQDLGAITDYTTVTGSLYSATSATFTGTCSGGSRPSRWYKVTVPASSTTLSFRVARTGTSSLADNNTFIELINPANAANCAALSGSMGCNDITQMRTYTVTAGASYYFRIYTTAGVAGASTAYNYNLSVFSNDNPCTATTLAPGMPFYLSTVSSASGTGGITAPICTGGNANDDVWFKFVPGAANITIGLFGIATSLGTSGLRMEVYSGACGSPTAVVGSCSNTNGTTLTTTLSGLSTSTTYYIRVFSFGATALTGVNGQFNIFVTPLQPAVIGSGRLNEVYRQQTLVGPNLLDDPWEVTYAADGMIWLTELKGYKVHRINPTTGVDQVVLDLTNASSFTPSSYRKTWTGGGPQGGMMGLALHPEFTTNPLKQFVYIAYVHDFVVANGTVPPTTEYIYGDFYRTWIVKFEWNGTSLGNPEKIIDTIRGSNDHNSGRLIIAPYNGSATQYLYYAVGDMGGGQFGNIQRPNHAQNIASVEGKILRFNLETDGDAGFNGFVPNDNPYGSTNSVWAKGIRNNQGFAYAKIRGRDLIYGSSHGPFTDDELNIIDRRKNYGHPVVVGFAADGNYDGARAGQITWGGNGSVMPVIGSETSNRDTINAANADSYRDPIYTFYPAARGNTSTVNTVQWLYNDISSAYTNNGTWPSEGTSGIDIYKWSAIPAWKNSIVISTLKMGRVMRLRLDTVGLAAVKTGTQDTVTYFATTNRYRDVAFSPGGKDLFVILDKSQSSSGPSFLNPIVPGCPGCLQKYTFLGYSTGAGNRSNLPNFVDVARGKPGEFDTANKVVINAANGNNNIWVPITDTNSNIIAEINAQGRNLDTVTTWFYTRTGTSRIKNGVRYLNRNVTISPKLQPGGNIWIRLYITKAELDQLIADGGLGAIGTMKLLKNNDSCTTTLSSTTSATAVTNIAELFKTDATPGIGLIDSTSYVIQGTIAEFRSIAGPANVNAASFYFGASLVTLPVELLTFTGVLENNSTLLQWKTTSEINTSYFDIERSIDGTTFSSIGQVSAQGNSNTETSYNYVDNGVTTLPVTIVYYRLKIMDANGDYKYSNVVSVTLTSNIALTISPNPVKHEATVRITTTIAGRIQWNLTDNAGRIVMQSTADMKKGNNAMSIDLSKLAAGIYYFKVKGAGLDQYIKVQKQ